MKRVHPGVGTPRQSTPARLAVGSLATVLSIAAAYADPRLDQCLFLGTQANRANMVSIAGEAAADELLAQFTPDMVVGLVCNRQLNRETREYVECAEDSLIKMLRDKKPGGKCEKPSRTSAGALFCECKDLIDARGESISITALQVPKGKAAFEPTSLLRELSLPGGGRQTVVIPLSAKQQSLNFFHLLANAQYVKITRFEALYADGRSISFIQNAVLPEGFAAMGSIPEGTQGSLKALRIELEWFPGSTISRPATVSLWGVAGKYTKYTPPQKTVSYDFRACKGQVCSEKQCSGNCKVICVATRSEVGACNKNDGCPVECRD